MDIDDILRQLKGVKRAGPGKWTARCCAHDDSKPSLSIKEVEGGRVLLNCFSGCTYETLASVLGIDRERYSPRPYVAPIRRAIEEPTLDAHGLWRRWLEHTDRERVDSLGVSLGVDTDALSSLGCAWASPHNAWAFPMRNERKEVIGIRLRNDEGAKWAVKGSRSGLMIPTEDNSITENGTLWLCEGPSDTAAALTIGLKAIGRPSCIGQEQMILNYIWISKARRLVIVVDNDEPGLNGAAKLQALLSVPSAMIIPPAKDLRQFVNYGGDYQTATAMLRDLVWSVPK
jgi:hypothetical protein